MDSAQIKQYIKEDKITTPSYILDMDVLELHVKAMKNNIADRAGLCYAMKANPFLVPKMSMLVDKIEVCSPGELSICQSYGIPGSKIIFSGVNKTQKDVEAALDYGVSVITAESDKHFRLICEYCENHNTTAKVLFRLTNGSQFGMDADSIERILSQKEEYSYIHVEGIHYFSGTQKKKFDKLKSELEELDTFVNHIQDVYGVSELTLEYGAGLPVPYFEGEDFEHLYQPLEMLMAAINEKERSYKVVLELGRFFAFSCGTYLTKVEEVKNNNGSRYVLVDGGIHQLNYYGQNMAMRVPKMELLVMDTKIENLPDKCRQKDILIRTDAGVNAVTDLQNEEVQAENSCIETADCTICGSLCTMADVLVRKWNGVLPKEEDVFAFYNAGSYSVTEAPALFLSRRMPVIYSYSEECGLEIIREGRESYFCNCRDKE